MRELLSPSFLATLDRLTLVSRRARAGKFKGERRSPRRGGSVEFADFREYAPGDDFRQIDWNAYARLERLFLRLFVEEEDATVHVIVDASRSMDWGQPLKSTYARRVAAALGYVALVGMDRLVGAALGLDGRSYALFPPHRGKHQALAWFDWLAGLALSEAEGLQPGGQASPLAALTQYAASVRRAGPLVVVSDLMDDGWREGIQRLAARHYEITLLHILAPQEIDPEWEGDLKLVDSETNAAVEITADFDLLSRYRARLEAWQSEWQQFCAARAINYAPIETSLPFEELVLSFLRRRGILK
ncbi:MAG TPA: DUF58 domain-containing protein [Anaerolineae bacterium]|nr:DUF58 domain-containing protein [Anaerolineae bacterium]